MRARNQPFNPRRNLSCQLVGVREHAIDSSPLFLLRQACLVWWSVVSPFKPYGPLIALIFVVGVAAIKAIIEDRKRHQEDAHLNNSVAHIMEPDGALPLVPACMLTLAGQHRCLAVAVCLWLGSARGVSAMLVLAWSEASRPFEVGICKTADAQTIR